MTAGKIGRRNRYQAQLVKPAVSERFLQRRKGIARKLAKKRNGECSCAQAPKDPTAGAHAPPHGREKVPGLSVM